MTRAALDWVDDHPRQPWMLYLHYFDPHDRYQAPPPWTRMHVDQGADRRIRDSSVRGGRPNTFMEDSPARRDLSGEELRYLRDLYRGEVSYLDHWLGRLLAGLRARGDLDRTIVVLTSDHGEEFLEHDGLKHGHTLYEELVAVPLVVLHPDGPNAGGVVSTPVSLQGLAPTLREWTGVAPVGAEGVWPLDEAPAPRPVAENWRDGEGPRAGPQRAVWDWPLKLIDVGDGRRLELYDLVADPGEQEPRDDPAGIGRLTAVLDSILGAVDVSVEDAEVDPALLEKLKAMGYVH